jgi:hypothetical protein
LDVSMYLKRKLPTRPTISMAVFSVFSMIHSGEIIE